MKRIFYIGQSNFSYQYLTKEMYIFLLTELGKLCFNQDQIQQ